MTSVKNISTEIHLKQLSFPPEKSSSKGGINSKFPTGLMENTSFPLLLLGFLSKDYASGFYRPSLGYLKCLPSFLYIDTRGR